MYWNHKGQNVSYRAPFNYVIRDRRVDNNDIIIRLHSDSRGCRQFREQGEGVTATDKMRVNCGQTVLSEWQDEAITRPRDQTGTS